MMDHAPSQLDLGRASAVFLINMCFQADKQPNLNTLLRVDFHQPCLSLVVVV
jgi:hypothetical protein